MTTQIKNEIQKIADQIVENYHPEKIILFGSYAWGKPTKSSDVDLFIVKKSNLERRWRGAKAYRAIRDRELPVDIVVYTPRELKERLKLGDFFINRIINEGHTIYNERKELS